jgi:hypothetical protein
MHVTAHVAGHASGMAMRRDTTMESQGTRYQTLASSTTTAQVVDRPFG